VLQDVYVMMMNCSSLTLSHVAGSKQQGIAAHCETRFGSKQLVIRSLMKAKDALISICATKELRDYSKTPSGASAREMITSVMDMGDGTFWEMAQVLEDLFLPVMDAMHKIEADKPLLSRVLPMINELEKHFEKFEMLYPQLGSGLSEVIHKRLREKYYKKCLASAYLLDPANFQQLDECTYRLPVQHLTHSERSDALKDVERLGGPNAKEQLVDMFAVGLTAQDEFDKGVIQRCVAREETDHADGVSIVTCSAVQIRRSLWSLKMLQDTYPDLCAVAKQYMGMHATSCASERNLSKFGRLFDKSRGTLALKRAEKMVFVAENSVQKELGDCELLFEDMDDE
jgi:hypothetical protein